MIQTCEPKWKWVVLFASFLALFIGDGWLCTFGMVYSHLLEVWGDSRAATSYIPTLLYGVPMTLSPIVCSAAARIGCRTLSIFAGITLCISFVMVTFCNSLWTVCLVIGILTSIGIKSLFVSAFIAVTYWFEEGSRGLATGIAVTGSGLGSVAFPHLIDWLMEEYMWRGMFLIIGGIFLNVVLSGCLYRPFPKNEISTSEIVAAHGDLSKNGYLDAHKLTCDKSDEKDTCWKGLCSTIAGIFKGGFKDCGRLLENKVFCFYCILNYVLYLWLNMPYLYIYDWSLESAGLNRDQGSWLLSTIGISITAGLLVLGYIIDFKGISPNFVYGVCIVVSGVTTFLMPFCPYYSVLLVCCVFFGFSGSATFVLSILCMGEVVGMNWAVAGLGMLHFVQGVSILTGTPVGGWIRDIRGSYNEAFYLAGLFMVATGIIFCIFSRYLKSRNIKMLSKEDDKNDNIISDA